MSMHIEGPWLSSISTRKRAEKITKAQREELERNWRDRNKRLKEMGLAKQTFEEFLDFVHGRKTEKKTETGKHQQKQCSPMANKRAKAAEAIRPGIPDLSYRTQTQKVNTTDTKGKEEKNNIPLQVTRPNIWVTGPTSSKPTPTYTGGKIVGIGTMHKSNMIPIFSDEQAKDISKMRR